MRCKRPTFHDEYLPTFNSPHVHLVDTAPIGVKEINENGVVHAGDEYPLDVLIYATGFQWMAPATFDMVKGRDGRTLNGKWQTEGTKTFLGLHSQGFPNLLIVSGPQGGGGSFNFTDVITTHSDYIAWLLTTMRDEGHQVVDVREESEDGYAQHCAQVDIASAPLRDASLLATGRCVDALDRRPRCHGGATSDGRAGAIVARGRSSTTACCRRHGRRSALDCR